MHLRLIALTAALMLASACGGTMSYGGGGSTSTAGHTAAGAATLAASSSPLGTILVDHGRTVYMFERDHGGASACDAACARIWPPLTGRLGSVAGSGLQTGLLSTIMRSDGTRQLAYDGHPLYMYAGDTAPGQTNGQGADDFGGLWWALDQSGTVVTAAAGGSTAGGSGSAGGQGW